MKSNKLKLVYIGNYPPRQCGIGTFTQNLMRSICGAVRDSRTDLHSEVIAMNNGVTYSYPEEVSLTIQEDTPTDYPKAAAYINAQADACILQHEYGIFGKDHGQLILQLVEELKVPLIVTLHTVLKAPCESQKQIVQALAAKAFQLVVMSRKAKLFLQESYQISPEKITIIEHGVPDFQRGSRKELRKRFGFENKKIILTFGLLGPGKGIETMIRALPKVVEQFPETEYWVLGKTHPNIVKQEGEQYRESLMAMAESLGVGEHLVMKNEFIDEKTLFDYLTATDIYVTPYPNEAQVTSGTLSYAIGAGTPVVSTPYWHAQELLAEGRGKYFGFRNSEQLGETLTELFRQKQDLRTMSRRAAKYGDTLKWSNKGAAYLQIIKQALMEKSHPKPSPNRGVPRLPELNFSHLLQMTDSTGVIQHAKYAIPNFKEGYCLDDNARALLLGAMARRQGYRQIQAVVRSALSYIYYVQRDDGWFHNFVGYDRNFLDKKGSEDAFGRTIWALGYALAYPPEKVHQPLISEIYFKAFGHIDRLVSLRAIAYSCLGLCSYLEQHPGDELHLEQLKTLVRRMSEQYQVSSCTEWKWYESILAYGNGLLPLALMRSLEHNEDPEIRKTAFCSLEFLEDLTMAEEHLRPIGCNPFYRKGAKLCYYDQQPIEAMAMVLLYRYAWQLTGDQQYFDKAILCFQWFTGRNDHGLQLYEAANGGCYDGLMKEGINRNQGAESTLAFLIARLSVEEMKKAAGDLTSAGSFRVGRQVVQVLEKQKRSIRLFQRERISFMKD